MSDPFETRLGFHILQVLEQRDQKVHIRQIFIRVEPAPEAIALVTRRIDSLRSSCTTKNDFVNAVRNYSNDPLTKSTDGLMRWISLLELPSEIRSVVDSLQVGAISLPVQSSQYVSIYRVEDRVPERKLTLGDDYLLLEKKADEIMSQKKLIALVSQWRKSIYIKIWI